MSKEEGQGQYQETKEEEYEGGGRRRNEEDLRKGEEYK